MASGNEPSVRRVLEGRAHPVVGHGSQHEQRAARSRPEECHFGYVHLMPCWSCQRGCWTFEFMRALFVSFEQTSWWRPSRTRASKCRTLIRSSWPRSRICATSRRRKAPWCTSEWDPTRGRTRHWRSCPDRSSCLIIRLLLLLLVDCVFVSIIYLQ